LSFSWRESAHKQIFAAVHCNFKFRQQHLMYAYWQTPWFLIFLFLIRPSRHDSRSAITWNSYLLFPFQRDAPSNFNRAAEMLGQQLFRDADLPCSWADETLFNRSMLPRYLYLSLTRLHVRHLLVLRC